MKRGLGTQRPQSSQRFCWLGVIVAWCVLPLNAELAERAEKTHLAQRSPRSLRSILSSAQDNGLEPIRTPILQNDTVAVTKLRFDQGARESTHTHPFPLLLIQITSGDIAVQEQTTTKRGGKIGEVWYVPPDQPHAMRTLPNVQKPIDVIAIALLPGRQQAPAAPPTEAPPGITRATLVDNEAVRVVRVRFSPGAREPVHSHPNDLLTVQLTAGKVDIMMGTKHDAKARSAGSVQFVPRNLDHSYANEETGPLELISVAVK